MLSLDGHELFFSGGERDGFRGSRFAVRVGGDERGAQRGWLVAARRALEQTLDGANASPFVLPSGRLRFRP